MREDEEQRQGKGKEGEKSEFISIMEQLQKEQEEQMRAMPRELMEQLAFNRQDPEQEFYREMEQISSQQMLYRKLGWKIVELSREEEDLTLFCFSILSAECNIPINFFTSSARNGRKSLWMQVGLHISLTSKDPNEHNMELGIYQFCLRKLLPLLRNFVRENINWSMMVKADYSDEKFIAKFRKQVVNEIKQMIEREDLSGRKK